MRPGDTVDSEELLKRFSNLSTYRSGDRRAPHKPLLSLIALQRLSSGQKVISFPEIEPLLLQLLRNYAPPVKGRHQPELPYWHLQSDGIWLVEDADSLPRQKGGFPKKDAINESTAGFSPEVIELLEGNSTLQHQIVRSLLQEHFPDSIHEDLLAQIGLAEVLEVNEMQPIYLAKRKRDSAFRGNVLRAYEHRCAVTGFRAALGGTYFGCEAAHVQWHAYAGPDTVNNGVCLEPTIHKLFDAGAWTLTDDRRILVSKDFTGSDSAVERLRERHGASLQHPLQGEPQVDVSFIRWHRESDQGGVFRSPAMEL